MCGGKPVSSVSEYLLGVCGDVLHCMHLTWGSWLHGAIWRQHRHQPCCLVTDTYCYHPHITTVSCHTFHITSYTSHTSHYTKYTTHLKTMSCSEQSLVHMLCAWLDSLFNLCLSQKQYIVNRYLDFSQLISIMKT